MPAILSPIEQAAVEARVRQLTEAGAPLDKARAVAVLQPMTITADLVDLAEASSWPLPNVARLYHAVGETFGFDRVRQAAGAYAVGDNFERMALRRLIEDLLAQQTELTRTIMAFSGGPQCAESATDAHHATSAWTTLRLGKVNTARRTIDDIEASGGSGPSPSSPSPTPPCANCQRKVRNDGLGTNRFSPSGSGRSVPEHAHAGEDHRQAPLVGGVDNRLIANGATGLDHRRTTGVRSLD